MPNVIVHPEVYNELESARNWYEEKLLNLGERFLNEIDTAINNIQKSPKIWPKYYNLKNLHRFLVHRFPFAIIYRYDKTNIQILAVAHLSRRPGYWKKRLD